MDIINYALALLDEMFRIWMAPFGISLYGIAIASGVIALFCRLRTPRRWRQ